MLFVEVINHWLQRQVNCNAVTHLAGGLMGRSIVEDNVSDCCSEYYVRVAREWRKDTGTRGALVGGQQPCLMRIYGQHKRRGRLSLRIADGSSWLELLNCMSASIHFVRQTPASLTAESAQQ